MAKILLVEDDNNLREIYEARLQAEGYEIVAAPDGEAALVVAKKELPDLVISDVMMPRISGFEMLDIMRNTEGLKHVRVIMLTALGQAEDKTRADALGADKYLVKSQVTLEDIVKAAAELVGGESAAPAPSTPSTAAAAAEMAPAPMAVTPPPAMPVAEPPAPVAPVPVAVAPAPEAPAIPVATAPEPAAAPALPTPAPVADPPAVAAPAAPAVPDFSTPAAPAAPDFTAPAAPAPAAPAPALPPLVIPDLTTPAAPVAPVAPTAPVAPDPAANTAAADTQLVNDAVKDLINGTASESGTEPTTAIPPPAAGPPAIPAPAAPTAPDLTMPATPAPSPAPVAPPDPAVTPPVLPPTPDPTSSPEPDTNSDTGSGEDVRTKRVIQPLGPGAAAPPTDINELMAKEGHALDAVAAHDTMPHQPGHVISPNPVSASGQPEDPNKISL